jgi:hypothetical protein
MSIRVFTTTGPESGHLFPTIEAAEGWLRTERYVARRSQPGQWVHARLEGNLFASVVNEDDTPAWTPNFGKRGTEVLAEAKVMADRIAALEAEPVTFPATEPAVIDRLVNRAVPLTFAEAVDHFRAVQQQFKQFGAADTEPNAEFATILVTIYEREKYWIHASAKGWQLTGGNGAGTAAKELRRAASLVARAGLRERRALVAYVRENGWA